MLNMSPEIGKLATALSAFQGEIEDAHRTSQGHNYKYADLGEVLALVRPLLGKHKLALAQFPTTDGINHGVINLLVHASGEWIQEPYLMPVTESRGMSAAQSAGAVLSYCRRYSILGIGQLTQVDFDGEVEEPEIIPATQEDLALLKDYMESGELPAKMMTWLRNKDNWKNMSRNQAETLLIKIKEA